MRRARPLGGRDGAPRPAVPACLVDRDEDGYLLQIFTTPPGFGRGNLKEVGLMDLRAWADVVPYSRLVPRRRGPKSDALVGRFVLDQ